MKRFISQIAGVALILACAANAALAHAFLDHAEPPVGGSLGSSPSVIRLYFTQGVVPAFSGVQITNESGASVPIGRITVDSANHTILTAPIARALPPGRYTVRWHVVSVDTHPSQGSFSFSVGR